jgi:hypothetical protein
VDDQEGTGGMGMGVPFGGDPVGRPAGVAETGGAGGHRIASDSLPEFPGRSHRFDDRGSFRAQDRHSGGVVAAVFELFESVQKKGKSQLFSGVSDDSAHDPILLVRYAATLFAFVMPILGFREGDRSEARPVGWEIKEDRVGKTGKARQEAFCLER